MTEYKKSLPQLFFPIFFENFFSMLTGMVDTLMLSMEGDQAVGAVGTANTYISIFVIMFSIISSGMIAVMTQYIGARRPGIAQRAMRLGLLFNLAVGIVISGVLFCFAGSILGVIGIAQQLLQPATTYLKTVGLFCVCNALIPIYSSYLRAFGHTTPTLSATILSNVSNAVLNVLFLLVLRWGVFGVALATGFSRVIHLVWLWLVSRRRIESVSDNAAPTNRELLRKIIQIGLPAAMETSLYNLAITIVISLLNSMDSTGMQATARAYAVQISNVSLSAGVALSQANAILAGWHIGAGQIEACDRETRKTALVGICLGAGGAGILAVFANPLLRIFTSDPDMIHLVSKLLIVDIALEIGRMTNLVYGSALKTSGDAVYPMVIAVVFAFVCAAGGTWLFGIHFGWLAVGAYAAMALDECTRAVFMFLRWNSGCWKNKNLLYQSEE